MRVFLLACIATIAIGAAGYFTLASLQQPTGAAYTTDAARIDPTWNWRSTAAAQPCAPRLPGQWFFVDFRDPKGEPGICSVSQ
ncbi:MAG TPA: hypothetical protein VEF90_06035 [Xanthobacteraceae bacterium]|nr:hypothetical protein [Xanthobacteraceae bacterium]